MDSCDSLRMQVTQLETELEDKQNDLYTAAELGKKLLSANQELQSQLEETAREYTERIESLEQERYTLQMKLDCQRSTYEAVHQELESTRTQLMEKHAQELKHTEQTLTKKIHELSMLNEDLKVENDKLEVEIKTCVEKLKKQEITIEQLQQEPCNYGNTTTLQQELQDLEHFYTQEKVSKRELELKIVDMEGNLEMLSVTNSALQQKLSSLEEECQERCKMANEWYEKLKEAKDQNAELTSQLETLKSELMGENHHKSGNSLFGEVDDRRLDVERKMLTLQVKYDSLVKTHSTTNHHLKKMKAEMSALLCRCASNTAHAAQVQRLQRALAQSKSETQVYMSQLHKLEKQHARVSERWKCMAAFVDFGNKAAYIQFLEQELERAKNDHTSVLKELDMKRTQLLWESNKLSETEVKLYHSEQEQAKHKKEVTKLRIKMQETLDKLEQATVVHKQLEADNKFLEEQLKSHRKNGRKHHTDRDHSLNTSASPSKPCSSESKDQPVKNNTNRRGSDKSVKCLRKEINILEELDHEFARQKEKLALEKKVGVTSSELPTDKSNASGPGNIENKGRHLVIKDSSVNQCPQQ